MDYFDMFEASDEQWARAGKCSYIYMVMCDMHGKHTSRCFERATVSVGGKLYCPVHAGFVAKPPYTGGG